MSYLIDLILLLCLGWGAYKGFRKGFIIQICGILALVLAIWGGFAFTGKLEPFMQKQFQFGELACYVVSFIIVFCLILLMGYTFGHLVSKVAETFALGMINRLMGAAIGIIANVLILSALILLFDRMNDKKHFIEPEVLGKTYLYKPIGKTATTIFPKTFFNKLLK